MSRRRSVAYRDPTANTAIRNVMRTLPQEAHADLGLIDNDHTPDMRKAPVIAGKHTTEAQTNHP